MHRSRRPARVRRPRRIPPLAATVAIALLAVLAAPLVDAGGISSVTQAGRSAAAAQPTPADPPASPGEAEAPPAASTPQRTGRDLPPRSQRISDTLIWLFLVLLLVAGVLLAVFPGQVRSVPRPPVRPRGAPRR